MNIFTTRTAPAANVNTVAAPNAPAAPAKPQGPVRFEVGQTYYGRFISNHSNVFVYRVVRRTEKSVWVQQLNRGTLEPWGEVERKALSTSYMDEHEQCYPMGRYSMCPILGADRPYTLDEGVA